MLKRFFILLILLGIVCVPRAVQADDLFQEVACATFDITTQSTQIICGYLTVPSNYAEPEGKQLRLAVVIFKAGYGKVASDPVFIAQGGPGGSAIETYASALINRPKMYAERDFVVLEQRGTLHSQPALYCTEYDDLALKYLNVDLPLEESNRLFLEAMRQCRQRLAREAELSDFNSENNARDIETLRQALGYGKINLYGVSYGSLLAQHYLRLYPDSLRSLILDGVVAPQKNIILESPLNQDHIFRQLFAACAADSACNRYYPNLEQVFYELVKKLDAQPVHLTLRDNKKNKEYPAIMDGQGFIGSVFEMLYSADFVRAMPQMIYAARDGDFSTFEIILSFFTFDHSMSYGMYYSVMCTEDADFNLKEVDLSSLDPRLLELHKTDAKDFLALCRDWKATPLGPEADGPVQSDVPTLLLSGGFDPITPSENARAAAVRLKNSYLLEFPRGAHGQMLGSECADAVIQSFWQNPQQSPDSTCIGRETDQFFVSRENMLPIPLINRILKMDVWLLFEFALFALAWLGLLSSLFLLPLAWFINLFRQKPAFLDPTPSLVFYAFGPLAWLNSLVLPVFLGLVVKVIFDMSASFDDMLLFGFYANTRPIFILPWLALLLTLGMFVLLVFGWRSSAWSLWRKIYYFLLCLAAVGCLGILAYWRFFAPLFT